MNVTFTHVHTERCVVATKRFWRFYEHTDSASSQRCWTLLLQERRTSNPSRLVSRAATHSCVSCVNAAHRMAYYVCKTTQRQRYIDAKRRVHRLLVCMRYWPILVMGVFRPPKEPCIRGFTTCIARTYIETHPPKYGSTQLAVTHLFSDHAEGYLT